MYFHDIKKKQHKTGNTCKFAEAFALGYGSGLGLRGELFEGETNHEGNYSMKYGKYETNDAKHGFFRRRAIPRAVMILSVLPYGKYTKTVWHVVRAGTVQSTK